MNLKDRERLFLVILQPSDLPKVLDLLDFVYWRLEHKDWFFKDDEDFLSRHFEARGRIFGIFNEDRLTAYAVLSFPGSDHDNIAQHYDISQEEYHEVAMLDSCIVHPDYRGRSFQYHLSLQRELCAKESGYTHLLSTAHPDNAASVNNLSKIGMKIYRTGIKKDNKIRHFMYKSLK
ncbi:GNAT family N-acetyltransferase [Paenibacillus radicis (ex Xue et al. 2023)]|uniref:N-acetyltransferase domain-containing protein n=1 Tax=Paenibacillus radicis (ex Xue et al. 2023) TaxID=2972489 RepID=A0ABT1YM08_9BACL|nr:GNAT family N-acetyltransferase [Paenibacillus radicis (ex Xue et al. 2023)]MCR8634223.1 hypothetical protein [Paenibacillus radicis (ex Xue et al. 2023)]